MQRVVGYATVVRQVVCSRPVDWGEKNLNGFKELKPITKEVELLTPIYEEVGTYQEDRNMVTLSEEAGGLLYHPK